MKLQHIMLRVYDIDLSLAFYTRLLDLKVLKSLELKDALLYYLAEDENATKLVLCYNYHHPEKYTHGTHFGYIGFEVQSMEEFGKKLAADGVEFERPPFTTPDGLILAFVKDPDGHNIEIFQKQ